MITRWATKSQSRTSNVHTFDIFLLSVYTSWCGMLPLKHGINILFVSKGWTIWLNKPQKVHIYEHSHIISHHSILSSIFHFQSFFHLEFLDLAMHGNLFGSKVDIFVWGKVRIWWFNLESYFTAHTPNHPPPRRPFSPF